jgi:hypothetical protein
MNLTLNPQDLLFGLAPLIIAAAVRPDWNAWLKFATAVLVCAICAILQTAFLGQFDFHSLGATGAKIFLLVMTTYQVIWKKFQPASTLLDWVEHNLNGGPAPAPDSPLPRGGGGSSEAKES